jgi:hypothetical protein
MNYRDNQKGILMLALRALMRQTILTPEGYPRDKDSILVSISKESFPSRIVDLDPNSAPLLVLPFEAEGEQRELVGRIEGIQVYPDGVLVEYPQVVEESALRWPYALLWVSIDGNGGILNYPRASFGPHYG